MNKNKPRGSILYNNKQNLIGIKNRGIFDIFSHIYNGGLGQK